MASSETENRVQADMQALAGRLAHRGSNTDAERSAAEYIRERFAQHVLHTAIDDFYSIDSPWMLFPAYYAEFTVVAILATWWPRLALCYGGAVFLAYIAEFMGYAVMSRFAPQYETQNVTARFLSAKPARQLVVMAHYDSGKRGPFEYPGLLPWLRLLHTLLLACMAVVLLSCAVEALGLSFDELLYYDAVARWIAAIVLLIAAAVLFINAAQAEHERGANDNASGTAVLLALAERFAQEPITDADVTLVATGSNRTWMSGARHFMEEHDLDRERTWILNIDSVGKGSLHYTTGEGLLSPQACSEDLIRAAEGCAREHGASPYTWRTACSDALIPLGRNFNAMSVTAAAPPDTELRPDTLADIDYAAVARAADFSEAVLRRLG